MYFLPVFHCAITDTRYSSSGFTVSFLIIPFYCRLRLKTPYTYLEHRFSRSVRTAAAALFILRVSFYLAVVLQAPAILLQQSTGLHNWITVVVCGVIATAFTMKGGMKTVIVTDFMQSIALLGGGLGALVFAIAGSQGSKSPGLVEEDIRVQWSTFMDIDSWSDDNLYFFFVGSLFSYVAAAGTDQIAIQRLMSTKDVVAAQRASVLTGCLNGLTTSLLAFVGLYIHAFYRERGYDPTHSDPNSNKIMFTFLLDESFPGLTGIIFGAILGCTLSVTSGGLNAAATSFFVDILANAYGLVDENTEIVCLTKKITAGFGVLVVVLAVLSTMIHVDIVDFSNTVSGLFGGPICALFLCGMFTKAANTKGMIVGFAFACIAILYIVTGLVLCKRSKQVQPELNKTCTEGILYYSEVNAWMISFWLGLVTAVLGLAASHCWATPWCRKTVMQRKFKSDFTLLTHE